MKHGRRLQQLQRRRQPQVVTVTVNWDEAPTEAQPGDVVRIVDVFGDGEGLRFVWSDGGRVDGYDLG